MSKIVSLAGDPLPDNREPQQQLVAYLREVLEKAESGEIQGVALVHLDYDRTANWAVAGLIGGYTLLGAATALHSFLADDVRGK